MNRIVLFFVLLGALTLHAQPNFPAWRRAGGAYLDSLNYTAALEVFHKGLKASQDEHDLQSEALFLIDIGFVHQEEGDLEKAYQYYEKGRAVAERQSYDDIMGSAYRNMATIKMVKGEYDKASEYLIESIRLFEQSGKAYLDDLCSALNSMGTLQFRLENYNKALEYYRKALPLYEELKHTNAEFSNPELDEAIVLNNIGEAYKQTGQYAKAIEYLNSALRIKRKLGLTLYQANTLSVMGEVYHALKNYPEALRYYKLAYRIRLQKQDDAAIANSANLLASLYTDTRQYREAELLLVQARKLAQKDSLRTELLKNYQLSRLVYRHLEQPELALAFDEHYITLFEQVKKEELVKTIHDLNIKYHTEQTDKELHEISLRNTLLEQKRLFITWSLYGIVAVALIIIAFILYAYRQKKRSKVKVELMMRELNHRTKNNFQQLSGLLSLYYKQLKDPEARKAVQETANRVNAMSVVHRKLYLHDNVTLVRIDTFISELAQELVQSYGHTPDTLHLNLELESLSIAADKAVPLSLIMNELLTNAFKYAFTGNADPSLHLVLRQADKKTVLVVHDNGPGMPAPEHGNESFGLRLIRLLCKQMQAELTITNKNGARIEIAMPQVS